MKKPLSKSLKTFYGVGDLGFSLMTSVGMYLQAYFLTDVAGFNLALVALIITLPNTIDAIFSAVYGAIIDGVKPMKWGKLRSWLLVAPPFVVIFMALQYTKIGPDNIAAAIIIVSALISKPLMNTPWVANVALIPLLANNPQEKVLLSSRRGFWSSLSRLFFSYISTPLALFFGAVTGSPILGYTILQGLMACCMWWGYLAIFKMTDGYEELPVNGAEVQQTKAAAKKKEKASAGDILRNLFQNPPLIALLLADYGRNISTFIISGAVAYYYTYVAQNMALMPLHLLITSFAAILGTLSTPVLNKKLNTRTTTIITALAAGGFLLIAKFMGLQTYLFIAACSCYSFVNGIVTSTFVALYSDTIVYGEWKTGQNTAGFIMGLMNLPLKVGKMTNGVIMTTALAAIGFVAKMTPTPALKSGIINIIALVPAIALIFTGMVVLFGFRLTEANLKQMQEEINARKQEVMAG
ncbi:putative symporter YjmB [Oxobacter pfennigii]|uniref:Putative symporter YjmB n=1 Tax=Oxobacter pfennigii TaxID=36849 RepID=A0A0P8W6H5_9CLOT|nr:MFS transporter [Oxobacter pfennigii]KPU44299.1 putative symporter YjmB [Oxobacter pfennigii]